MQTRVMIATALECQLFAVLQSGTRLGVSIEQLVSHRAYESLLKTHGNACNYHLLRESSIAEDFDVGNDIADPQVVLRMNEEVEHLLRRRIDLDRFFHVNAPSAGARRSREQAEAQRAEQDCPGRSAGQAVHHQRSADGGRYQPRPWGPIQSSSAPSLR